MLEHKDYSQPKTVGEYARLFFTGIAMGAADTVPGVSGGTMAFILGVYENLIDAIKSFNPTSIRLALSFKMREFFEYVPFRFLIALGLGIGTAILALAGIISGIMDDPGGESLLFAFFFGLVIASIISVGAKVKWSALPLMWLAIGSVTAFVIVNIVPAEGSHDPLTLFISGAIAICAMILPGISGSFILLILGQYDYVLTQVSERNVGPLLFVAVGCVVGIVIFSRVLSYLLKRFYHTTVAALVGFMVGSLWKIWPWKECVVSDLDRHGDLRCLSEANLLPATIDSSVLVAVGLMLAGFLLVSFLDHMQTNNNLFFARFWKRRAMREAVATE
jgi:putative membrane protein